MADFQRLYVEKTVEVPLYYRQNVDLHSAEGRQLRRQPDPGGAHLERGRLVREPVGRAPSASSLPLEAGPHRGPASCVPSPADPSKSTHPRRGLRGEEPLLQGAHRVPLSGIGVVPAADVQGAVGHEEPQLVGRRPADVAGLAAAALVGLGDGALDRDRRCRPGAAGRRRQDERAGRMGAAGGRAPGCGGNASGGRSGNDRTSVGPRRPCASAFNAASSASVGQDQPERGRGGRAGGARAHAPPTRRDPARRGAAGRPLAHGDVDPPGRPVDRRRASVTRQAPAAGAAPRLELDDLVLRVGDPLVVHAQQLRRRTPRGSSRRRAASGRTRRTGRPRGARR